MDVLKGFSERLSELMQENGLNAESLGKAINIAPPVIRRWCLPYKDAYYKNVVRVADYFNCSLDFLCGRSDIVLDISGNLDRLRELAQADRDGRCVVLPCIVGDDVWINIMGRTIPASVISVSQFASTPTFKAMHGVQLCYVFKSDDVGKTVFLTREEAENKLKERNIAE